MASPPLREEAEAGGESRERVIPYATPTTGPIDVPVPTSGRGLFGVVVRVAGLGMTLWGAYTLFYLLVNFAVNEPLGGQSRASLFLFGIFLSAVGIALLRGEWIVRFAYGPPRAD